jgi:hypothetical protein
MKKALVIALMFVLGLGLFASAQTWEGTWDTDVTVYPAAAVFSDFIGFDSDLTVTMSVGGWDFSMDADFSVGGMDGLGFDAEGVIGAFSFDINLDFEPMLLSSRITTYTNLTVQTGGACLTTVDTWTYDTATTVSTYGPAFDDLTVEGSVNIAGLSFGALFYLKGTDMDQTKTYSNAYFAGVPLQFSQTEGVDAFTVGTEPVLGTTKVGSGAKFTISGSFAGATITNYTYFNLSEYSYNDYQTIIVEAPKTYIKNSLKMSGSLIGLVCPGCNVMFTRNYTLIEGLVPFGDCLTVDLAIDFTCCGFGGIGILFTDISLGCCWDLSFDFLIEFATTSKTMTLEPSMTFANGCFTIIAEVDGTGNAFTGIQLEGLSYSHAFNGVTVSFAATWDYYDNPLISWNSQITHNGASKVFFWKPDTHLLGAAVDIDGKGDYVLDYAYCTKEVATVINKLSLDFDADGCCGGLFDLDVDTYFGNIAAYTLQNIYGTYYVDEDFDTALWDYEVDFLGSDNEYSDYRLYVEDPTAGSVTAVDAACDPCPAPADAPIFKDSLKLYKDYGATGITLGSMLGWVETDADIVFGVGSNISLGLGLDVAWWGWQNISFSIEFIW